MSNAKRQDLQGLRGVAIIAVLLFHFYPQTFPNGYIGVDIFFVLSGFLISMILTKQQLTISNIFDFYYRRAKRILPLYLLLILFTILSAVFIFPSERFDSNLESAKHALLFYSNIAATDPGRTYTAMVTEAADPFTHTWSLAVEMQFYMIVPLLFCLMRKVNMKATLLVAGITSIAYGYMVEENVAFNSVFARMWQFMVGVSTNQLTYYVRREIESDDHQLSIKESLVNHNKRLKSSLEHYINTAIYVILIVLIVQSLYIHVIPAPLLRFSSTILSGAIILLGSVCANTILTNRFIVYFGDISYALYLIHWPVYAYVKENNSCTRGVTLGLIVSGVFGIFLTESFEKFYLSLKRNAVLILIGSLFLANAVLLVTLPLLFTISATSLSAKLNATGVHFSNVNLTEEEVINLNQLWYLNDRGQLRYDNCHYRTHFDGLPKGWCDLPVSPPADSAPHSLMIVGNSWAANMVSAVHSGCQNKVSNMTLYWIPYCEVFIDSRIQDSICDGKGDVFVESIKEQHPDTLLILVRHIDFMKLRQTGNGSILDDDIYRLARKRLAQIEPHVRRSIYILQSVPWPKLSIIQTINDNIKLGATISNENVDAHVNFELGRRRVNALVEDCEKCKTIDYSPFLTDENGKFRFFDARSGLSHFTQTLHLTPIAIQKVAPLFEELCQNL